MKNLAYTCKLRYKLCHINKNALRKYFFSVTKDIQDRIYYIEDVLETQELNQESPVTNNIFSKVANDMTRGISRIGRASRTQLG